MSDTILTIKNLKLAAARQGQKPERPLVDVGELRIERGEVLALAGETGSGKSLTAAAISRLFPSSSIIIKSGEIIFNRRDILTLNKQELKELRGRQIAMIFQDPMAALNPVFRIGTQILEVIRAHFKMPKKEAVPRAYKAFEDAGLSMPEEIFHRYPHELSGGQRQRVCIAMALACSPTLLIADEPTTALDVTIQAQIIRLLDSLRRERNLSILFITHNLGLVRRFADRVAVMKDGCIVEAGPVSDVFSKPAHKYTRELLAPAAARPQMPVQDGEKLIEVRSLCKSYTIKKGFFGKVLEVHALHDINLTLSHNECLGIVGESGSGKTTLARILMRLEKFSTGFVSVCGQDVAELDKEKLVRHYSSIQMVYQDSAWAMDPFMTIENIVAEALIRTVRDRAERRRIAREVLSSVGLGEVFWRLYPAELSGGQRQRVGIARAMIRRPKILVLDEPTSALDVKVQEQILSLILDLRRQFKVSYIVISHDLNVIRSVCDSVVVLCKGRLVESGPVDDIFNNPGEAYTRALIDAAPRPMLPIH
ncbi:MAG: ABC transporter ATP-binding protein [Spirochaetaceae bacterium]|nr:ABC transporter ATP-binding protein [Spirochaetaceae bacterium]